MEKELERILQCEKEYTDCTSICYDRGKYYEYADDKIKDMYDHNFFETKDSMTDEELQDFVSEETKRRKENKISYCKVKTGSLPEKMPVDFNGKEPEIEHVAAYVYKGADTLDWKSVDNCEIKKVTDKSMIKDLIAMDIDVDGKRCTEDFCRRRAERMGNEYLSDSSLNMYVCYLDGQPVGSCELYMSDKVAKIESFSVLPKLQRKGIGTTILKYLMEKAKENKSDIRYLIADEDDTPKEMYVKLGFEKLHDIYSLFWQL